MRDHAVKLPTITPRIYESAHLGRARLVSALFVSVTVVSDSETSQKQLPAPAAHCDALHQLSRGTNATERFLSCLFGGLLLTYLHNLEHLCYNRMQLQGLHSELCLCGFLLKRVHVLGVCLDATHLASSGREQTTRAHLDAIYRCSLVLSAIDVVGWEVCQRSSAEAPASARVT